MRMSKNDTIYIRGYCDRMIAYEHFRPFARVQLNCQHLKRVAFDADLVLDDTNHGFLRRFIWTQALEEVILVQRLDKRTPEFPHLTQLREDIVAHLKAKKMPSFPLDNECLVEIQDADPMFDQALAAFIQICYRFPFTTNNLESYKSTHERVTEEEDFEMPKFKVMGIAKRGS